MISAPTAPPDAGRSHNTRQVLAETSRFGVTPRYLAMLIRPKNNTVAVTVVGTVAQIQAGKGTIVLSAAEAAHYLGVSRVQVHRLRAEGKLKTFGKTTAGYWYRQQDLDQLKQD